MALWNNICAIPQVYEKVRPLYQGPVPLVIRMYLADWLEEKFLYGNQPRFANSLHSQEAALQFHKELISRFELKAKELNPEYQMFLLQQLELFKTGCVPLQLIDFFQKSFQSEEMILKQFEDGLLNEDVKDDSVTIKNELENLQQVIAYNQEATKHLRGKYEQFFTLLNEVTNINALCMENPTNQNILLAKQEIDINKDRQLASLTKFRIDLVDQFSNVINRTQAVQSLVINQHLKNWKHNQSKMGYDVRKEKFLFSLDTIQGWCASLAHIIWSTRMQINQVSENKDSLKVDEGNVPNYLPQLMAKTNELLKLLMYESLVIEKQPPQVIKKPHKISVTLRLLTGAILNVRNSDHKVSVSIECDGKVASIMERSSMPNIYESGELLNSKAHWEYNQTTNQFTAEFRNLQVKERPKNKKRSNESVLEEKVCLFFTSEFKLGDLKFDMWTYSLPIVVTVHGSQDPQAFSTIMWDQAFGELERRPFFVPAEGPWSQLVRTLSAKFEIDIGRGLTTENEVFLFEKVFGNTFFQPEMPITWSKFCKEQITDRTYNFWEWFYQTYKFTLGYLKEPWKAGLIMGFVSRTHAEELLKPCPPGTFLLRFSDGEPGSITIAYRDLDGEVQHIQPFTPKDLETHCLAESIANLAELETLYPDIPKSEFKKYIIKQESKQNSDYVFKAFTIKLLNSDRHRREITSTTSYMVCNDYPDLQFDDQIQIDPSIFYNFNQVENGAVLAPTSMDLETVNGS